MTRKQIIHIENSNACSNIELDTDICCRLRQATKPKPTLRHPPPTEEEQQNLKTALSADLTHQRQHTRILAGIMYSARPDNAHHWHSRASSTPAQRRQLKDINAPPQSRYESSQPESRGARAMATNNTYSTNSEEALGTDCIGRPSEPWQGDTDHGESH